MRRVFGWFVAWVLGRQPVDAVAPVVSEPEPSPAVPVAEPVSEQAEALVAIAAVPDERLGSLLWRVLVGTAGMEGRTLLGSLPPGEAERWLGAAEAQLLLEQDGLMLSAVQAVREADEQARAANLESGLRALKFALGTLGTRGRYQTAIQDGRDYR